MYRYEYDSAYEPEYRCKKCEEKEQLLDEAAQFMQTIVEQLYSRDTLDKPVLQHCIEELCGILRVKNQHSILQIARHKPQSTKIEPFVDSWLQFNDAYLKELV